MPSIQDGASVAHHVADNISTRIVAKDDAITFRLIALLCRGHILLEDMPGVSKTALTKALGRIRRR